MNKYAIVNREDFPIVKVTFTTEKANDENFPVYLNEVRESYNEKDQLAIIFDATHATLPALKYQKMQAQWLKEHQNLMTDYCAGTAYIISNSLIRNVLRAIFAFQKQPVPYLICSNASEAENWVREKLG